MAKIAVFFPGVGYTTDKPLLYYGQDIACEAGYEEQKKVNYTYVPKENIRGKQDKMRETFDILYSQAKELLADMDWSRYDEILFVSKSIGTIIASCYAKEMGLTNCRQVLYTPLEATYQFAFGKSIAFIGTADPWSKVPDVIALSEKAGIPITVYDNLNHSLEGEDTLENLRVIQDVMEKTKEFLS